MEFIAPALRNILPGTSWKMNGAPASEQEFLQMFEIVTHISEQRDAVYSNNRADFGVTWAQIAAEAARLKAESEAQA